MKHDLLQGNMQRLPLALLLGMLTITLAGCGNCSTRYGCDNDSGSGTSGGPNSCLYAYDDVCDEPDTCSAGTDTFDCEEAASTSEPDDGANSCEFAFDDECDEPFTCSAGTDTYDCE